MSNTKPGEIRCPTCHRSTPPLAFCTQCGAPVPSAARIRPRGMDRDGLDDRIRQRRSGDAPFRRGMGGEESAVDDSFASGPHEPFRPEPEDALARRPSTPAVPAPRVDRAPEEIDARPIEPRPVAPAPAPEPPVIQPAATIEPAPAVPVAAFVPVQAPPVPVEPPAWSAEPPYDSGPYDDDRGGSYEDEPRGGGFGPLAVVAVVALGLMAIGLGAILSGVFSGVASASPSPSPTPTISVTATASATAEPTGGPTSTAIPTPVPTAGPVVFADGFTAQTQPCLEQPTSFSGCSSSGSTVSGSSIWVWVGFRKGNDADLITASILDASGATLHDGSVSLSTISCGSSCNGWLRFRFSGLAAGSYGIRIDRNGQLAAESSFTVSG